MIYFSSDFHLYHNRDFLYQPRGYTDVYTMSNDIIKIVNETVGVEDELYLLGDLILNDNEQGRKLLAQIKCPNIHIILGNHDTDERIKIYENLWNIVDIKFADRIKYDKWTFFLTHYPCDTWNFDNGEKKINQIVWNLCGHCHTQDRYFEMEKGLASYHVEWDAHERPVSIDEIIRDIKGYCNGETL